MTRNLVLFSAYDGDDRFGLWESDGTAAGTQELTGIAGTDPRFALYPGNFLVLDRLVLFDGIDSADQVVLWATDGTAAGTIQLTGVAAGATAIVAYNGEGLFQEGTHLWSTDGTVAGTHDLGSLSTPTDTQLYLSDSAVVHGGLLTGGFYLVGAALHPDNTYDTMFVTDGTADGTHEVTGIANIDPEGLASTDITAFDGQALFNGYDANGKSSLWKSDGTGPGTYELAAAIDPNDITPFGDEALFLGVDSADASAFDLWVTDGTAAGTRELNLAGTLAAALSFPVGNDGGPADPDFTALNGEVLFRGVSPTGTGLWETDGTAAGTHEITGIAGAYSGGVNPSALVAFDGEAMFSGTDASGVQNLWLTDGTASGTHEIVPADGQNAIDATGLTVLPAIVAPPTDFNGDGKSDILLQSGETLAEWLMNGAQLIGGGYIDGVIPNLSPGWRVLRFTELSVAPAMDFNGDGNSDILLGNGDALAEWQMNGAQVIGGGVIDAGFGAGWSPAGVGDFNGDGNTDILFYHETGNVGDVLAEWLMNGVQVIGGGDIDGVDPNLSPSWAPVAVGDFNGDGKADILLQDANSDGTTTLAEWQMNGVQVIGGGLIGTLSSGWTVAGIGDFNGDGKADILLQQQNDGGGATVALWLMNGTQVIGGGDVDGVSPDISPGWGVVGIGDYNGDGKSDLLLWNGSTGGLVEWLMNGAQVVGGGGIGTVSSPWLVAPAP